MKKCQFCAEEIQDEAIKCKHCGSELTATAPPIAAKKKKDNNGWWGLGIIVAVIIGLSMMNGGTGSTDSVPKPATTAIDKSAEMQQGRSKLIDQMINELGLLSKTERSGTNMPRAWVTPRFMALDFDQKQKFLGVVYAYYLDGTRELDTVAVISSITGKEIGRFSPTSGLRLN